MLRRLPLIVATMLMVLLPGISAFAHATLESSNPAEGSTVKVMPSQISLTFNEELMNLDGEQVNTIALLDGNSEDVSLSDVTIKNATIAAKVNVSTFVLPGDYRIKYRVVSADGHPIEGEVLFTYAEKDTEGTSDAVILPTSDEGINTELIAGFLALIVLIALLLWLRKRE